MGKDVNLHFKPCSSIDGRPKEAIWSGAELEKFSKMCNFLKKWDIYHHYMAGLSVTIVLHLPFPYISAGWLYWSSSSKFWGGLEEVKGKFIDQKARDFWNQRQVQNICSRKTQLRARSATHAMETAVLWNTDCPR